MDNLEIFQEYDKKYRGQLMLFYFKVILFGGMILDQEDDFYYQYFEDRVSKPCWLSGVAKVIFLKDILSKNDYEHFVEVWNNNNEMKAK